MEEQKKAFVLMPFKEPYNSYYEAIYKPALEAASYVVKRADDLYTPHPIIQDIQQSILDADLILCDMSERNPNVFYELGLAHAIGKPAILVARKKDDIPFDLRHVRVIFFDYSLPGWEEKLRHRINATAQTVNQSMEVWPRPLIDIKEQIAKNSIDIQEVQLQKIEIENEKAELKSQFEKMIHATDILNNLIQVLSVSAYSRIAPEIKEINKVKAEALSQQEEFVEKLELQKVELEKARSEFKYRQENWRAAIDAIVQTLSNQTYPPDSDEYEVIKQLLFELREATAH